MDSFLVLLNEHFAFAMVAVTSVITIAILLSRIGFRRRHPPDEKLRRGGNYRNKYFAANPGFGKKGFYICPYCGKLMWDKKRIEVDHIHSIHRVQNNRRLTEKFMALPDGVNSLCNLTHACRRCNRRKGSKGGIWVFLGRYGTFIMLPLRLLMYGVLIWLIVLMVVPI